MKALLERKIGDLTAKAEELLKKETLSEEEIAAVKAMVSEAEALRELAAKVPAVPSAKDVADPAGPPAASSETATENSQRIVVGEPNALKEKGVRFARFLRAVAAGRGIPGLPEKWYEQNFGHDSVFAALQLRTGAGTYLAPPEFAAEVIELLRARSVVRKAGVRTLTFSNGKLTLPRFATGTAFSYVGEGTPAAASGPTFDALTLTAKILQGFIPISNDLLKGTSYNIDQIVRDDAVAGIATKEDITFIRSDGSGNTPTGLRYIASGGNIIAANATVNIANVKKDLSKLRLALKSAFVPLTKAAWIISPRTEEYLLGAVTANDLPAFPEMQQGMIGRYPYFVSEQIPENLGVGTDETEVYFVDFDQFVLADSGGIELAVSTEASYSDGTNLKSAFAQNETVIRVQTEHDFGARHPQAVAVLTGVKWIL